MINRMFEALLAAFILTMFNFEKIVSTGAHELFGVPHISIYSYYFIAAIIGLVVGLVEVVCERESSGGDENERGTTDIPRDSGSTERIEYRGPEL